MKKINQCSVDWCKHFDNWKCTLKNPAADEESCFDFEDDSVLGSFDEETISEKLYGGE